MQVRACTCDETNRNPFVLQTKYGSRTPYIHLTLSPSKCPRLLWRVLKGSIVVTSSSPRVSPAGISASTKAGALKSFGLTCEKGLRERGREGEDETERVNKERWRV